ncbi:hypothetical protein C8R43DRAFT_1071285 [Mycena crocata]|nr:hypothetical protein C8R43DRAFT_1071285 [Mycena crocata]
MTLLLAYGLFSFFLYGLPLTSAATSALSFASSKWIWTPTDTPNAFVALRKDFTPPLGKSLIAAEIITTADNAMQLFVNGDFIGSGTPIHRARFANRYCVDLLPSLNVFAVNASTTATSGGGVIATILLTYSDGTKDTILSDSSWRVSKGLPAGFTQLSFDDTAWPVASVAGVYGAQPWGTVFIPASPVVLGLERAQWMWTDVVPASGTVPAGSRAFRRTFIPAPGQIPASASIIVAADNQYTLFVNGVSIGSGTNWKVAQRYTVNFASPPEEVVLAVRATNTVASAAGVIVAVEINMQPSGRANCTAGSFVMSDAVWKSTKGAIPAGFEQPGFDDSAWPPVVAEATYPAKPWGAITIAAPSAPVTI